MTGRVRVDGKFFARDSVRHPFRGVTYGTFAPRYDGARFPEWPQLKFDLAEISAAGFTVVRTYTEPPDDMVELAEEFEVGLFAGVHYDDWRYMLGASRRQQRAMLRRARQLIAGSARRLRQNPNVVAFSIGNEIPADVVRWVGPGRIAHALDELADVVHDIDPELLVTYGNYPSTEYLELENLDFATFNVFVDSQPDLHRYLSRLQHVVGERPLVIGEVGYHVGDGGGSEQATRLEHALETVIERGAAGYCVFSWTDEWWVGDAAVEGWRFGLTTEKRDPRPSLAVTERWNQRTVADLDVDWPSMSVIICAYNAEATLDECLRETCTLDYPDLEIIVVDDGSVDATADITRRHTRAGLLSIPHGGLSVARNEGFTAAKGEIVAYLDSDAYPSPEWPYFLALSFDDAEVVGAGGPNVPPSDDGLVAQRIVQAPGGPAHVLLSDTRAEHVPGCNMAFWRNELVRLGGFDPIFTAAGDDVDFCWRILDSGGAIGFHPAALVWHHRRNSVRAYLRQQRGYGRSEALVESRHPDRFTPAGSARWRGSIYGGPRSCSRSSIYRGVLGAAPFQSIYRSGNTALTLCHQLGSPLALAVLAVAVLMAPLVPVALVGASAALTFLLALGVHDAATTRPPRRQSRWRRGTFRLAVALLQLTQPLARLYGRLRSNRTARRETLVPIAQLPGPAHRGRGSTLLFPLENERAIAMTALLAHVKQRGIRMVPSTSWDADDARLFPSFLIVGRVVSSAYPVHWMQVRVIRRLRWLRASVIVGLTTYCIASARVAIAAAIVAVASVDVVFGLWQCGRGFRRHFEPRADREVIV